MVNMEKGMIPDVGKITSGWQGELDTMRTVILALPFSKRRTVPKNGETFLSILVMMYKQLK